MSLSKPASPAHKISGSWRGLGAWNVYFLGKFLLTWTGHLNFQVLPNLIFALVLLIPIGHPMLRRARTLIAIPVAVALLYQDTWFPPFSRLLAQPGVLDFSFDYIVELLGRFIDWQVCAMLLLLVVGYLFLSQWLRLTTFTLLGFAWLSMGSLQWLLPPAADQQMASTQPGQTAQAGSGGEPDDATLNGYLDKFYLAESSRKVEFKDPAVKPPPFDLLVINICSMAWDDLDAVGLRDNSLFSQMDVIFDNFNSATAYSGPAAIRLLRASCGQTSHAQLYKPPADQCLLFDDLRKLGFSDELMLNHTGEFDGFLQEVREQGELPQPALGVVPAGLPRTYVGFDGSPIWRDRDVLSKWWQHRLNEKQPNMALFYNTTTLHDGNRQVQSDGGTHVPVGIKLINMGDNGQTAPVHITEPSSYLAVAEIIARLYADPALSNGQTVDWTKLLTDLPQTAKVSENSGTVVLDYNGKPYVRIKENGGWLPYPQKLK